MPKPFMIVVAFVLALCCTCAAVQAADKPNVVFILADDLGYTDLGCYGSKYYETPHIDRMAAEGLRFTSGYACGPNCQPTRAALMSGQYGPRTGVYTVGGIDRFPWQTRPLRPVDNVVTLPPEKITIAEALRNAGYATGMFGKWHLGEDAAHHPSAQGFDEAVVSMGRHFKFKTNPTTDYPPDAYLADFLTDKALDFIRRRKDGPFFLYLPHFAVHVPLQAKQSWIQHFQPKPPAGGHDNPVYAGMIASVDDSVGRVLALLDELHLSRNTLVIFSSDNGGVGGYERTGIHGGHVTDNAPLKGGKGMLYEGGVRIPYIFRWPGRIAAGAVCDAPINSVDLYPTLLAAAGAKPPAAYPLDGASYLELLVGGAPAARKPLFWHFPGYLGAGGGTWRTAPAGAVRAGDWKLLEFFEDGRLELYNLKTDIGETQNLAAAQPEKVKELHAQLAAWRSEIQAPLPTRNEPRAPDVPRVKNQKRKGDKKRSAETPPPKPLSFHYANGTAAEITIQRNTDLLGKSPSSQPVPIVCQGKTQQAKIAPVQGQAYVYCSFPMGPMNPTPYENNHPMAYQVVTLGQTVDGKFTPAIRFGMVDDDRGCAKGQASYAPGMYNGAIGYFGMYARPGTTYDFKMKLDLSKGRACVWVAGRGDDAWLPLAYDVPLMNPVTALNAARVEQLPQAPGIEDLVVQNQPWPAGEAVRPHPLAKKNRVVGPGKGFKFQPMKSFWRDAERHVTVARTPHADRGWWLGFPDVVQTGPTSLVACYVDGTSHGAGGYLWVKHSNDLGRTWTDPLVISQLSFNCPRLQRLKDGSLLLTADIYEPQYPCLFFRSTDGGHTWTQIGKLAPQQAGGPEAIVPSRIVETDDGAWVVVSSHCPGQAWHVEGGEQLEFYRSADRGKTWSHFNTIKPPYPLGFSEASIVPLPDGRWVLFARESSAFISGVRMYSSDQGKTWSKPEELPFAVSGRTCAGLLQDGRVLLTFRNHCGLNDLWAWAAGVDEPLPPLVHGVHVNDRRSVGLGAEGLVIDSDGQCGQFTNYRFRPPDSDQSHIDVTAEVKAIDNAGRAATLSIPFVGKLRFFPDKVQLEEKTQPAREFPVAKNAFHTYRVVCKDGRVTLSIDGREVFANEKWPRRTAPLPWSALKLSPYAMEFGNEPIDDATAGFDWVPESVRKQSAQPKEEKAVAPLTAAPKTITPAVTGCSVWRRFTMQYDDPQSGVRTVAWSAANGKFPDQYQLDRLVEIGGASVGWDQGYSGWTQLKDGRILILNYTDDTARWNRTYPDLGTPWIRGTFCTPDELPAPKP